jgi:hypothetical protein
MKRIPKNISVGEMWDSGVWEWRLWLLAPFIPVITILGGMVISGSGGSPLWFVIGYPLAIVEMILFKMWDKKVSIQ